MPGRSLTVVSKTVVGTGVARMETFRIDFEWFLWKFWWFAFFRKFKSRLIRSSFSSSVSGSKFGVDSLRPRPRCHYLNKRFWSICSTDEEKWIKFVEWKLLFKWVDQNDIQIWKDLPWHRPGLEVILDFSLFQSNFVLKYYCFVADWN